MDPNNKTGCGRLVLVVEDNEKNARLTLGDAGAPPDTQRAGPPMATKDSAWRATCGRA